MQSLIASALLTNNKQEQLQAQAELCSIISNSPDYYLTQCSTITLNESHPELLRQSAGTLLAKAVKSKPNFESPYTYWDAIQLETKELIKNNLLSTLTTSNQLVKRSAANAIASIASVEVVRGEWPTLVPNLVRIIGGEDLLFVQTAIMTLGFICQEIAKGGVKLPLSQQEQIFKGIILGFKAAQSHKNLPLRRTSLEVLRDGLNFFVDILEKMECRSYIFRAILQGIHLRQTAQVSIQALGEYCKYASPFVDQIVIDMNQVLSPKIQAGGVLGMAAIQIWNSIGNEYLDRRRRQGRVGNAVVGNNHLLSIHQDLSKLFMQSLIKVDDEELVISATNTLGTLVSACGCVSFPLIVNFISNTISCSDDNVRQASLLAFSALTESDQTEVVLGYFSNALTNLTSLLKDPSPIVLTSTLEGFARIFQKEVFVSQFIDRPDLQLNVGIFLDLIAHKEFTIKQASLKAMGALFEKLKVDMSSTGDKLVSVALKTLTESFFAESESIPYLYLTCIINLLKNNASYQLVFNYITYVVDKMETMEQDESLISGGMSIIAVGVRSMPSIHPNTQFMDKIFEFVVRYFVKIRGIDPNGLPVLGSLASTYKKLFNKHFNSVWSYILAGLSSIDDSAIYTSALCCLSDISIGLGEFFVCNFEQVMKILLEGLASEIRGEVKLLMFDTISDLIGVVKMQAQPFVPEILKMVQLGITTAVLSNEDRQYIEDLRTCIIRIESDLYYTLNDFGAVNSYTKEHFPQLLDFVMLTCRKEENPTVEYLRQCVQLCYMCVSSYQCPELIRTPEFEEHLNQLQHFVSTQQGLGEIISAIRRLLYNPL